MVYKIEAPKINKEEEKHIKKEERTLELNEDIFNKVKSLLEKYIDTSESNLDILTLWIIGTYFHSEFESFPLLQLYAQKRSGKTRTLKLLSSLCYGSNGSVSTSITETFLFRHKIGALFFDELESINSKEKGTLRELLNSCYKKGNRVIRYKEVRAEGKKDYVEEEFFPFYPIALANINGLNDVLEDRAIQIILKRSSNQLTKLVEDFQTNTIILELKEILNKLKATIPKDFFSDWNNFIERLELKNENLKPLFNKIQATNIYGRSLELFFPLFIIAYSCGIIDKFLITAKDYVQLREEFEAVDDIDERLKNYLNSVEVIEVIGLGGYVELSKILSGFRESLENPEQFVNSEWLGRALKRLDLISKKRLVNGKTQVIINKTSITSTTPTHTTTSTTSTTSTILDQFTEEEIKQAGWTKEKLEEAFK